MSAVVAGKSSAVPIEARSPRSSRAPATTGTATPPSQAAVPITTPAAEATRA